MSFCPDNVILARLSGSFAPCQVSALAGHYDDEGVIYLRQRVVNVMQSEFRVVSQKTEVIETPLSASERKPGIQGGVLNGRKRRDKIEDVPLHRE
jgi:hypothetical protein